MTAVSKTLSLRIDGELSDWLDEYVETRSASKTQVVEMALRELRALANAAHVLALPPLKQRGRKPTRERICFRCKKCIARKFYRVLPDEPPECTDHGPMVREINDHRASSKMGGND